MALQKMQESVLSRVVTAELASLSLHTRTFPTSNLTLDTGIVARFEDPASLQVVV